MTTSNVADVYGGAETVARNVAAILDSHEAGKELLARYGRCSSDVETIRNIPRGEVLEAFFCDGIALGQDILQSPIWTPELKAALETRFKAAGCSNTGDNGSPMPEELAFTLFVQDEVLTEVCGPDPQPDAEEIRKLEETRNRFWEYVQKGN